MKKTIGRNKIIGIIANLAVMLIMVSAFYLTHQ